MNFSYTYSSLLGEERANSKMSAAFPLSFIKITGVIGIVDKHFMTLFNVCKPPPATRRTIGTKKSATPVEVNNRNIEKQVAFIFEIKRQFTSCVL